MFNYMYMTSCWSFWREIKTETGKSVEKSFLLLLKLSHAGGEFAV